MGRFDALEARLVAWAMWRMDANAIPTGGYGNPLAGLVGEGAEIERGSRSTKSSIDTAKLVRKSLQTRLKAAKEKGDEEAVARLKRLLEKWPATPTSLPWASLIHGNGPRPDPDCPEEEETEMAVAALSPVLCRIVKKEYLVQLPQPIKAKEMGYSLRTYERRLNEARRELLYRLDV